MNETQQHGRICFGTASTYVRTYSIVRTNSVSRDASSTAHVGECSLVQPMRFLFHCTAWRKISQKRWTHSQQLPAPCLDLYIIMFHYSGNNNSVSAIFQSPSWDDEMNATVPVKKSFARRHLKKSASEKKVLLEKGSSTSSASLPSKPKIKRLSLTVQTVDLTSNDAVAGSHDQPPRARIESGWTSPKKTSAHGRRASDMHLTETDKWYIITAKEKPTILGMAITFLEADDDVSTVTTASGLDSAASSPTGSVDSEVDIFRMTFKLK